MRKPQNFQWKEMTMGTCYYPEHWSRELWQDDLQRMKAAGITVIRVAEFAWNKVEPEEGVFTFDFWDEFMELCKQEEMQVIFGTPTATPPAWLTEKYPEVLNCRQDGVPYRHGARRHYNYNSPKYRELSARIVEKLAQHYGKHPAIVGWQIDNELNCEVDEFYSEADSVAFRNFVKEKYKTLDNLNEAWGTVFWNQTYTDCFKNRLSCFDCRIDNISCCSSCCFSDIPEAVCQRACTGRRERIENMRILGLGDCCVDYYIHKKMAFPGGNAFNVAVYAAENGAEAGFLGTVGDDVIGEHILKCAREKHVDISHCPVKHGVSGRAAVNIVDGDRVFVSGYFEEKHGVGSLYPPMLSSADLNYVESFQLVHSSCYAHVENQIERVRALGPIISFDFSSEDKYRTDEYLKQVSPMVDMALFSCEDMSDEECISFAKKVQGYGGAHVLMTRGKGGQLLVTKDGLCHKGQAKLIQAVDTMGAGDSFFAAFLVTLLKEGWTKDSIITESMIEVAFAAAADFSGRNCLREGSFGMGLSIEM